MDHALTRRGLLAGFGVAAGAAALGSASMPAMARSRPEGLAAGGLDPAADALVPGLTYRVIDAVSFTPRDFDSAWPRQLDNLGSELAAGGVLVAALDLPVGGVLRQVTLYYVSPPGSNAQVASLQRKPFIGAYEDVVPPVTLNQGPNMLANTWDVNETVNGTASYALFVNTFDRTQLVGGLRFGYVASPSPAFFPLPVITRVLDTRKEGGKLAPDEERIVTLGIPGTAGAGVFNLTVTETEAAGYVSVFRADQSWPGNSSINWSAPDQNIANGVIADVDGAGRVKIRGGVNRTHVVIDVQGWLP